MCKITCLNNNLKLLLFIIEWILTAINIIKTKIKKTINLLLN